MRAAVRSSLQFLVVRHQEDAAFEILPLKLQEALQGQTISASADMGGIVVRDLTSIDSLTNTQPLLAAALHTVALVLVGLEGASDSDWITKVQSLFQTLNGSQTQFSVILIFSSSDAVDRAARSRPGGMDQVPALNLFQHLTLDEIGEKHVWPHKLTALAFQRGRVLLAKALYPNNADYPHRRFFISHAKEDGIFLAQAVRAVVEEMPEMEGISFYDERNIANGARWDDSIRQEARNSTIIALRTDRYCERAWCMREIIEAEDAGAPVLIVDARASLSSDPAWPPLDSAHSIRIPHGNITSIVIAALLTHLMFLALRRSVQEFFGADLPKPVILPRSPNLISLAACVRDAQNLREGEKLRVVYPGAEMEQEGQAAAQTLLGSLADRVRLLAFHSLSTTNIE